jgi:NDP-sugar pyrophosphorylase family protein
LLAACRPFWPQLPLAPHLTPTQEFVGDKINAGIYVVNPSILDRIELRPTSIEREVFPHIAADNKLFAFTLPGYWMDVGQPKDYLKGEAQCEGLGPRVVV